MKTVQNYTLLTEHLKNKKHSLKMKVFTLLFAIFACFSSAVAIKNAVCGLKHSADGNGLVACAAYIPSWSYNGESNECVEFVYGGCGGNNNRFNSQQKCEEMCKE